MAHPEVIEERVHEYFAGTGASSDREGSRAYQIPDFFARKRMEEELRKARDELEQRVHERTAELRESNELVRREMEERQRVEKQLLQTQKLEAIGRLAGGIAHDFNNLMAIVIGNAGLLARRVPEGDPMRAFVDEIVTAGKRASGLTQQLLTFSRAQVLSREAIDLTQIVCDLVRMLERVIGEEVSLSTHLAENLGFVEADRGQIEQVVMNLVVNGRDAMPNGGTLTVETANVTIDETRAEALGVGAGAFVKLSVADTGTGMDEHVLAHLFDPFFTTKTSSRGTGLGLSTVYGIVKQAGGAIEVKSALGEGSRFDIFLPRVAPPTAGASERRMPPALRGVETLLVVEDQAPLRRLVGHVLRDFGYTVLEASDATEALEIARRGDVAIDLLLTDVVMPRMRGPELAAKMRAERPRTKVLFMSGYMDDASLAGTDGGRAPLLIAKPFSPEALARKVREVLDA
jgi:signal transduction histidine kinase